MRDISRLRVDFAAAARSERTLGFVLLLAMIVSLGSSASPATKDPVASAGVVREFSATPDNVRQALQTVVRDQIIHGTLVYDKDPILSGAEVVASTPLFAPWEGPGEVYYKICQHVIAPRHFLDSADQGTIAVRYVLLPVTKERVRVRVDAVYVESAHRVIHISDGTVEKMELKELKDRLDEAETAAQEAADAKRRKDSAEIVHQTYVRQREDETSRLSNAESNERQLQQLVADLRQELERRVKQPGAELKAAPFKAAAILKSIPAGSELVVLIVTPNWLGVETTEGQRGWIEQDRLEPLPK